MPQDGDCLRRHLGRAFGLRPLKMAKNWNNFYLDNSVHLVTGTVHQWQPMLLQPEITEIVYGEINSQSDDFGIVVVAYVIMPEHFHLLVYSTFGIHIKSFLQSARRAISGKAKILIENNRVEFRSYCRRNNININAFYELTAGKSNFRFWKEKPRVIVILNTKNIAGKIDYLHNNPVRRGLVKYPDQWQHSSFGQMVEGKGMASGCHLGQIPS